MKITACSIVKNEEKNIARSIKSYKDVVDEIIIVDTGSTDNTVDICRSLGATVLNFQWNNDFSAARNYALDHATGDWIIFLDADEWFVPKLEKSKFIKKIKEFDKLADGLLVKICEYDNESDKVIADELVIRVFKNDPKIRFTGKIHEKITRKDDTRMKLLNNSDLVIYHSGYSSDIVKQKSERNLKILYSLYNEGKIDTPLLFYLFRENYTLNIEEAIKFYNLFMERPDADYVIKNYSTMICIYEYMYKIMLKSPKKYTKDDIFNLLNTAYNKYPTIPVHSYFLGVEYLKLDNFLESYNWINKAIYLNEKYTDKYTNTFVSYINEAYYNIGNICKKLGKIEEALSYYVKSIKNANNFELTITIMNIIEIIQFQPPEEIILFINSVFDIKSKVVVRSLLEVLKNTRLHKVFIYYAIKYNQEFDGQDETTYIAMILSGQAELAVDTAVESSKNYKYKYENENYNNGIGLTLDNVDNNPDVLANNIEHAGLKEPNTNWHLDYAIVGILYSKSLDLYYKYNQNFTIEQNSIISAYLTESKINEITEKIIHEHKRIYNLVFNILDEGSIKKFSNIVNHLN